MKKVRRGLFSEIELLLAIAIVGIIIGMMIPVIRKVKAADAKPQQQKALQVVTGETVELWARKFLKEQFPSVEDFGVRVSVVEKEIGNGFYYATVRFYDEKIELDRVLHLECSSSGSKERFVEQIATRQEPYNGLAEER